jgi:hypothetical protein
VSEGLCPGRCSTRSVRSRSSSSRRRLSGLVTSTAEPHARKLAETARSAVTIRGDAVAQHQLLGEAVFEVGLLAVAREERRERVERRDLRAGAAREDRGQAEVVHVLVGDHEQLDVLDRVPVRGQRLLELVQRLGRVRARVDERQRRVLDQVGVDAPDHERRGDRQAVDARVGGERQRRALLRADSPAALIRRSRADQREHLVAAALHVLGRDERLQAQAQQRLGVGGAHVEVPVLVVDRDPVQAFCWRASA